jgi:5-methylcytosine-specific restriction endonuclease McrA
MGGVTMPITAQNKTRYPKDWQTIRGRILARAENKCELCGIPNLIVVIRDPRHAEAWWTAQEFWEAHADGERWCDDVHDQFGYCDEERNMPRTKRIKVILTIAHLDHQPENNDPANLKALCQRCHLRHDSALHQDNARKTRAMKKGEIDMLEEETTAKGKSE